MPGRSKPTTPPVRARYINFLVPSPYEDAWTDLELVPFNTRLVLPAEEATQQIQIGATLPVNFCLLSPNPWRNYLLIQNNSTATGSGGIAPSLYVSLDGPAAANGLFLQLFPGASITLNRNVPKNSIFLTWGASTAPVNVQAVVHHGTGRQT